MDGERGFLVEDFIDSLTSQLDRVQDALRVKAVNRPLTYALKELSLDLKVNVDMDEKGQVRFRSSAPGDSSASSVHLDFTTITKPMIEENTIGLAATRSPSLEEAGFKHEERRNLERMGVRNVAELVHLRKSAGDRGLARLSRMPVSRLRQAFAQVRPRVGKVTPVVEERPASPAGPRPPVPTKSKRPQPQPRRPIAVQPVIAKKPATVVAQPRRPVIRIPLGTRRLRLAGANFQDADLPTVSLDDRPLQVAEIGEDHLIVDLPAEAEGGTLAIATDDGEIASFALSVETKSTSGPERDPWAPMAEDVP